MKQILVSTVKCREVMLSIPVVDDDRRLVGGVGRADVLGVLLSTDRTQSGAALRGHG